MEYLDHALEQDLHTTLHKGKVYNRKKVKHSKDNTRGVVPVKKRRMKGCGCVTCQKSWSWGHKHKRTEKVFTEEESQQYFSYCEWFDHDGFYDEDQPEDFNDYYCTIAGTDHTYNEYLEEIGLPQLCSDFDWQEYSVCKAPEGCKVEVKDYNTCAYCGNKHQHCNCFE